MEALTALVMAYFMMVAALLVIPVMLAVFVPPLGGPLVAFVLRLCFVAPIQLISWLLGRGSASRELAQADADQCADASVKRVNAPPGWYNDPRREARLRWWDGVDWTEHSTES